MQAVAAEIIAIMGGKFPHFMTSIPGGTTFVPTEQKLDDILFRFMRLNDWVTNTMIPDTLAIAPFYADARSSTAEVTGTSWRGACSTTSRSR
jgi:[NiFe] hydrogenase large subunit